MPPGYSRRMMSVDRLLAFSLSATLIIVIPGPGVLFGVGRALAYGRRTALASMVGGEIGVFVMAVAVAVGLGVFVERSLVLFTLMKLAGAGYLVYLGVRAWRDRRRLAVFEASEGARGFWRAARDGFLVSVSNPKTVVFLVAVLPQFVDRSRGHASLQMLILGLIFVLIALLSDSTWCLAADAARTWFGRSPRRLALVGGVGGLAMIGLGLGVAISGRKD
jgi:threonine/homoserine/homoserine lactone efflux protein